jgi:sugar phosphate isomerase/epimerase
VGRGILDWPAIFAAAKDADVRWYIVEQDECRGDSLESARISAEFMRRH